MKNEEYRNVIPTDTRTVLPKGEQGPCMRGTLDLGLYNRTGEIEYIEPLEVFVPPVDPLEAPKHNPYVRRKGAITMNPNKPKSEALEKGLRSGLPILNIAKKYDASVATVHDWIRGYGLAGIRGKKKDAVVQESPPISAQESPSLAEIEQFHTDEPVQELPKVEWEDQESAPILQNKGWNDVADSINEMRKSYADQADIDFKAHLTEFILDIMGDSQRTGESGL